MLFRRCCAVSSTFVCVKNRKTIINSMENCAACSFLESLVENVELEVMLCYVMSCCLGRNHLTEILLVPVSMWVIS